MTFYRYWEAPNVGEGLGDVLTVPVYRKGDYLAVDTTVTLTSRVFRAKDGFPKAYAEEAGSAGY